MTGLLSSCCCSYCCCCCLGREKSEELIVMGWMKAVNCGSVVGRAWVIAKFSVMCCVLCGVS